MSEKCRGPNCVSTELVRAHVIPRGFARDLGSDGSNISMSIDKTRIANPQQGEFDEHILCAECDGRFGRLDNYAITVTREFSDEHLPIGERQFEVPNSDSGEFLRFVLALLWRASVSSRPIFNSIALGKYEDIARDVAFGRRGISDFPQFSVILTRPRSEYDIDPTGFFTYPKRSAFERGLVSYHFAIGGFRIIAVVDSRPLPPELTPYLLTEDGPLRGVFQKFETTPEFRAMADMLVADAIRRGVPPWEVDVRKLRDR